MDDWKTWLPKIEGIMEALQKSFVCQFLDGKRDSIIV